MPVTLPVFELTGKTVPALLKNLKPAAPPRRLANNVTEYTLSGPFIAEPALRLHLTFQVSPDNPVLRFQYRLESKKDLKLTKQNGENLTYLTISTEATQAKEVRFSEFNEQVHATHLTEYVLEERHFANNYSFMGPLLVWQNQGHYFLLAYEHGSQFPDSFLRFGLNPDKKVILQAVKGNYLAGQTANTFSSVWLEVAGAAGTEDNLAQQYRTFMRQYITENKESRQPYIFYNTWGRQERSQWEGKNTSVL